ncbi:hypothetical protein E1A91_D10G146500v1 [Gossypium mustelinum]|uniref:Uncharacterized protein n=1 Tax=Gossypium mustelinum TaxID=34275 RepID=A0A5D2T7F4_GOSMU|nr:hypothetical protein E1A91_D10G146500v1 [Gossypium mustelinum]
MAIIILLVLIILAIPDVNSSNEISSNSYSACPENEKQALLVFKEGLIDDANRLASWDPHHHPDCCTWFGVVCGNMTGHILSLNLSLPPLDDTVDIDSYLMSMLKGKINPFLSNLKHLRYLQHVCEPNAPLDLSNDAFEGLLPYQLGNLSISGELHLSNYHLQLGRPLLNVNLSTLAVLDLSYNFFTNQMNLGWVSKLNSLVVLNLAGSDFHGPIPNFLRNMTSLRHLDLSYNNFKSSIPEWLYRFSSLQVLSLSANELQGDISSAIFNISTLNEIDLSWNDLEGKLPRAVGNLCNLRSIVLSSVRLNQDISHIFEILSVVNFGQLTDQLEHFKNLKELSSNDKSIFGPIPTSLGKLANLEKVEIYNNLLEGVVSGKHFANHTKLRYFEGWDNSLVLRANPHRLVLETTKPIFVCKFLYFNNFSGPLPQISMGSNPSMIDLSNNYFLGPLFHFLCFQLNATIGTRVLSLANNLLSGEIPDCWIKWQSLQVLRLDGNRVTGKIPSSMGTLSELQSLHLHNKLHGEIPLSLKNCRELDLTNLIILILRSNKFGGSIPDHLRALNSLHIFDLADNNFFGSIPRCISNFTAMVRGSGSWGNAIPTLNLVKVLDFSRNKFSGKIPHEVTSLQGLQSLNLSQNHLSGKIPENIGGMKSLESLDLSQNQLSGSNLSSNNFTGRIPTSSQLQSFNESCYAGNHLCGSPLKDCKGSGNEHGVRNGGRGIGEGQEVNWFYVSMPLGFVSGFWCVLGPLVISRQWRIKYFRFLEQMWWKVCDFVAKIKFFF